MDDYQRIRSYLQQLDKMLNGGQTPEQSTNQISLEISEGDRLSGESIPSELAENPTEVSPSKPESLHADANQLQSTEVNLSAHKSTELTSIETAGILEELLEPFSGQDPNRESVEYQELLQQVACDHTDPETIADVNDLLNRFQEQASTDNEETSILTGEEAGTAVDHDGSEFQDDSSQIISELDHSSAAGANPTPTATKGKTNFWLFGLAKLMFAPAVDSAKKPKMPAIFWRFSLGMIIVLLAAWGVNYYDNMNQGDREKQVHQLLTAAPELAFYRLNVNIRGKTLSLTGQLPSADLRDKAETIVRLAAPDLVLDNQITVVDQPATMAQVAAMVQQVVKIFNQIDGINIAAKFDQGNVTLTGTSIQHTTIKKITQIFQEIPGVRQVDNQIKIQPISVGIRIYFPPNSAQINSGDWEEKIGQVKDILEKYPHLHLRLIGYSDRTEFSRENLALKRAEAVENMLEKQGIDRRRLQPVAGAGLPPDITLDQEKWLRRTVIFEIFDADLEKSVK